MLDGRVKTLHPKVHGGILARRDVESHRDALARARDSRRSTSSSSICIRFAKRSRKPGCTLDDAIENIDIGGPAMVRSAAKNWMHVGVVVDPADYAAVLDELRRNGNALSDALRFRLMQRAFAHTAAYDGAIANWLDGARRRRRARTAFRNRCRSPATSCRTCATARIRISAPRCTASRRAPAGSIAAYRQLQGKELSYNNVADADAAWACVTRFAEPTCVIVKHANPCGVASAAGTLDAYANALATDPTSAFGGIIAFNRAVDAGDARGGRRAVRRSRDRAGLLGTTRLP